MSKTLIYTPVNSHGCRGYEVVIEELEEGAYIVRSGSSCSSCWQVGHDEDTSPIEVGSVVVFPSWKEVLECWGDPESPVLLPSWGWSTLKAVSETYSVEEAAEFWCGYSHNALVDDRPPYNEVRGPYGPEPDCTVVWPKAKN